MTSKQVVELALSLAHELDCERITEDDFRQTLGQALAELTSTCPDGRDWASCPHCQHWPRHLSGALFTRLLVPNQES